MYDAANMRLRWVVWGVVATAGIAHADPATDLDAEIAGYEKAYAAAPSAELLWSLADAHRRAAIAARTSDPARAAAHRDAAIDLLRQYIDTNPPEDRELTARGWLGKLQADGDAAYVEEEAVRREQAEQEREGEDRSRGEAPRERAPHQGRGAAPPRDRGGERAPPASELGKARTVERSGVAAIAGGVVATGLGAYFGLRARALSDELTDTNLPDADKQSRGAQDERYMAIAYATGGALIVGGAITYWIGHRIGAGVEGGEPGRWNRTALALAGTSVVLLGAAVGFEASAERQRDRYDAAGGDSPLLDSADHRRYAAEAFGVAGLACAGASAWLYVRGRDRDAVISPMASSTRVGLQIGWSY